MRNPDFPIETPCQLKDRVWIGRYHQRSCLKPLATNQAFLFSKKPEKSKRLKVSKLVWKIAVIASCFFEIYIQKLVSLDTSSTSLRVVHSSCNAKLKKTDYYHLFSVKNTEIDWRFLVWPEFKLILSKSKMLFMCLIVSRNTRLTKSVFAKMWMALFYCRWYSC